MMTDNIPQWITHTKCPDCDEMIPRGIKFMTEHWVEKHGGKYWKDRLIDARTKKGSELTVDDLKEIFFVNE